MRKITLAELGNNLSVGTVSPDGASFVTGFDLKRYKFKDDKKLAEKREEASFAPQFASQVIAYFTTELAGKNFGEMKQLERLLAINQMWMGDVLTLYFAIRMKGKGKIWKPLVSCPFCKKHKFRDTVDLSSTECVVFDKPDELESEFVFSKPYEEEIGTGDAREIVTFDRAIVQPPKWQHIEALTAEQFENEAFVREAIYKGSIKRLGDYDEAKTVALLAKGVLDELDKLDVDDLDEHIGEYSPGPEMVIETKCDKCRRPFSRMIDWTFDNFFGTSSRSGGSSASSKTSSHSSTE